MHMLGFMYVYVFGFDGKWQIGDYDGIIFYTFVNNNNQKLLIHSSFDSLAGVLCTLGGKHRYQQIGNSSKIVCARETLMHRRWLLPHGRMAN